VGDLNISASHGRRPTDSATTTASRMRCATRSAWQGKIDDALLGPVLNKVFGDMVCGAQQQVEIKLDDHHGALLQDRAGQVACG
jgi:hypothetical protein